MNEAKGWFRTSGFPVPGMTGEGGEARPGKRPAMAEGEIYPRAEEVRGEVESLLEGFIALLQEARLLAESLREAAGDGERMSRLCGALDAVTGELEALEGRMGRCLSHLPGETDMATLARVLDRGERGAVSEKLELVERLASEVLQLQAANEKLFFLLREGMERYISLIVEAWGGWVPYDRCGARRWDLGWKRGTL